MSEVCQRCVIFSSSCPGRMRSRASSWWAGGPGYPRFRRNCLGQLASECVRVCVCVLVCSFILFMVSLEHSFFYICSVHHVRACHFSLLYVSFSAGRQCLGFR